MPFELFFRRFLAVITIGHLLVCAGCNENRNAQDSSLPLDKENTIVPGFGIPSCHVGMAVSDLQGNWIHEPSSILEQDDLVNATSGIAILHRQSTVIGAYFHFTDRDMQPFVGRTQKGIGADSSIEEVIQTYGQPVEMSVAGPDEEQMVYLNFLRQGMAFDFIDGQLEIIAVALPLSENDPEYPKDIGDIGNTSKYRGIAVGK